MASTRYPLLYQVNTRVWLTELGHQLGRKATLDNVPDAEIDRWQALGFDWIWLLSVWQTGPLAQEVSRTNPQWRREFEETLLDLTDEDIPGSGFAITGYTVHENLGGDAALARLRERMQQRGLKLMLDFVPNHMGLGHPWALDHPEYFVLGSQQDLARSPQNYTWVTRQRGDLVVAHGRDPYFDGWPDTLQLNYANPDAQDAMLGELTRIAGQCDGVRCDMAMLVLPDVFERTWGKPATAFWEPAIAAVRRQHPDFCFLAEVYWDLEWRLQQQGFDYCYDKRLYDRLRERRARPVRDHFLAGLDYQDKLARFLENHDEPRAAAAFPAGIHQAAAVLTYLSPGLRFFHQGQFEGCTKRISPHLGRGPRGPINESLQQFYRDLLRLLSQPVLRSGNWRLLQCDPGWDGNPTHEGLIVFSWESGGQRLIVAVNYAEHPSQGHVRLPLADLGGRPWRLVDQLSQSSYDWNGDDLLGRGLYLDMQPWQACAFSLAPGGAPQSSYS